MRVHELAKKLGMPNKELIEKLNEGGIEVKTHSSGVDEAAAMKVLGVTKKAESAPKKKPRTVVRRRRSGKDDDDSNDTNDEASAADADGGDDGAAVTASSEPEPTAAPEAAALAAEEAAPAAAAPAEEAPAPAAPAEEPAAAAAAAPAEAPAAAAAPAEAPAAAADKPAAEAKKAEAEGGEASGGEDDKGPSNVVRVIDAEAIKSRLRAEGRSFDKKPRRTFSRVREIRVVNDRFGAGPQMIDVTGQTGRGGGGGGGGGGGPGGAGGRRSGNTHRKEGFRDRREARGREMWVNPGRKKKSGKKGKGTEITQAAAHKRVIELADVISVADLAHKMSIKAGQVISKLMQMGMMVTVNQTLDYETAAIVAQEFSFEVKNVSFDETDILDAQDDNGEEHAKPRAPVVTVMGHVDHGKTSLLDHIRKANVVSGEAGGITQHIGAYSVKTAKGQITFLDTPGHAAFTAMRARGAEVTDIVILVVAADDGVMPQTKEAIDHAKAAKVPIVVAINKIDKPGAKPERVMQELTEHGLVSEEWGGDTMMVQVSALKGTNIDGLLEAVLLQAEVGELKADPTGQAKGTVVEAQLDKGRGPVATVLITQGTLKAGEYMVAGEHAGRVRAMYDSAGKKLKQAGPSMPVQVLGLSGVPDAGDRFDAVSDDKTAKQVAEHRSQKNREEQRMKESRVSLDDFLNKKKGDEEVQELRLVVKADVGGSLEALSQSLENLTTRKVRINIVRSGVGTITETDVNLALASQAIVIGFNTKPDAKAAAVAQHEKVDIRTYRVIYECLDEVRAAMAGLLAPRLEERYAGTAEVRQLFRVPKLGTIAGSYVTDGKMVRAGKVRVKRGDEVLFDGEFASLKRFKDDVREVASGYECGIGIQGFNKLEEGDLIECYEVEEVRAELDEALVNLKDETPPGGSDSGATEAGAPA